MDSGFIDEYILLCIKEPILERAYLTVALNDIKELLADENIDIDYLVIAHELTMLTKEIRYVTQRYSPKHLKLANIWLEFPNTVILGFRT